MECWKCGRDFTEKSLKDGSCFFCGPPTDLHQVKNAIAQATTRVDKMGKDLEAFREKLGKWRKTSPPNHHRDINRWIHHLCLMADEIEENGRSQNKFKSDDVKELEQKLQLLMGLTKQLKT